MSLPRLKIAIVAACPFPWPRGTPIRAYRISEALTQLGHEVHAFTYHLGKRFDYPFEVHRIRDFPQYRKTEPGPTWQKVALLNPALTRLLRAAGRAAGFDVVHAHHYEGLRSAANGLLGTPIVYDAHTTLAGELPDYRLGLPRPFLRWLGARLDRRIPKKADHTIAVSEAIRQTLLANGAVAADAIDVIPNGVSVGLFRSSRVAPPDSRQAIFTGNDANYQRLDLLLEAFERLLAFRPDARIKLVGSSSCESVRAEAARRRLGSALEVATAPFSEEVEHLAAASVAISPRTRCDGLPQKLLNYMAAGKAIVACEGSAGPLAHDVTGLRVPNDDPDALARAIVALMDDPGRAGRLGAAARAAAQERFSWETVARRIEGVYASLLERNRGSTRRERK